MDQLQRKAESIGSLDSKIAAEIENADDLERDVFEAEEIKDTIIEKTTRLKRYLELNKPSSKTSAVARGTYMPSSASRLPKLSLPKFSGDPIKWQSFWDSFEAAVHANTNLTGVEKLNYLRAQLEDDAARTVSGFALTNPSYEQSVSLLKSRFGKRERIVSAHYQALLDLDAPTNTAHSLRRFLDDIESHIRGLEALKKSKASFGDFLVPVVNNKLPPVVKRSLTRNHTSEEWTIDELTNAINKEVLVLEAGSDTSGDHKHSTVTSSFHTGIRRGHPADKKPVSAKPVCVYCKGYHVSTQCDTVTDTKVRMDVVRKERLCFNCLGQHKASNCNSKIRCKKCHRKHHTSLCETPSSSEQTNTSPQENQSSTQTPLQPTAASFVPAQHIANHLAAAENSVDNSNYSPMCLLKTAVASVRVGHNTVQANILFDEEAQRSFITQSLANQLGSIPHFRENVLISSFGGDISKQHAGVVRVALETNLGDVNILAPQLLPHFTWLSIQMLASFLT